MTGSDPIDAAGLNVLRTELRRTAIKRLWPACTEPACTEPACTERGFTERVDKEGWNAARLLAALGLA